MKTLAQHFRELAEVFRRGSPARESDRAYNREMATHYEKKAREAEQKRDLEGGK